jgi:carboxypeptidase C (cathepsin A)
MSSTLTSARPARVTARQLPRSRLALASLAAAAIAAAPTAAQETPGDHIVTTEHRITLDGRPLRYTARAGLLPIRDNETGEVRAQIYFMAYMVERTVGQPPRPLAFLWNGGPGMNSSLVHLLGFGPKRVKTGDSYPTSPPLSETELEDNQETWLDQMDLVFVDPVGTGYSRPAKAEYADAFYETPGDAEAVAEFVRLYRVRFDAWDQPLFIAGHSYGTTRAMAMSAILERRGIPLNGVVLMSGSLAIGQPTLAPELSTALAVPAMTAAAHYHKKLSPDLQRELEPALDQAEEWALKIYAPGLGKRDTLGAGEREALVEGLSRYTGVPAGAIDRKTLGIERDQFRMQLLPGRMLGMYDYRMSRPGESQVDPDLFPELMADPSFAPAFRLAHGTSILLNRYMRQELRFESDLSYQGPLGGGYPSTASSINRRFKWNREGQSTTADPNPPLRRAMHANPAIRVFLLRGLYDSLGNGCARHVYTARQLDQAIRSRVMVGCYRAGHDFYTDKPVRQQVKRDMMAFVQRTLAGEYVDRPAAGLPPP